MYSSRSHRVALQLSATRLLDWSDRLKAFRKHLLMYKIPFLPSSAAESCQTNRTQPTSKTWVDRCSARKAFEFEVRARLPSTNGMLACIAPFEFGQYMGLGNPTQSCTKERVITLPPFLPFVHHYIVTEMLQFNTF